MQSLLLVASPGSWFSEACAAAGPWLLLLAVTAVVATADSVAAVVGRAVAAVAGQAVAVGRVAAAAVADPVVVVDSTVTVHLATAPRDNKDTSRNMCERGLVWRDLPTL